MGKESKGEGSSSSGREIVPVRSTLGQRVRNGMVLLLSPLRATIHGVNWVDDRVMDVYRSLVTYTYFGPTRHLTEGFAPAGPNAIGLVMVSSMPSGNAIFTAYQYLLRVLQSPKLLEKKWGHTGIYVRVNGTIRLVVGFGANGLTLFTQSRVRGGRAHSARIYDNQFMLDLPTSQTVEFKVDRDTALRALRDLRGLLKAFIEEGEISADYTTNPERRVDQESGPHFDFERQAFQNCVLWAVQHLEQFVGRQLLVQAISPRMTVPLRVVDQGPTDRLGRATVSYNASSQGRLVREINYLTLSRNVLISDRMEISSRHLSDHSDDDFDLVPRVGSYPRSFQIIRLAGNVFVVGATIYFGSQVIRGVGMTGLRELSRGRMIAGGSLATYGIMQLARDICHLEFERLAYRIGMIGPPLLAIVAPEYRGTIIICSVATWSIQNVSGLVMRAWSWLTGGNKSKRD